MTNPPSLLDSGRYT